MDSSVKMDCHALSCAKARNDRRERGVGTSLRFSQKKRGGGGRLNPLADSIMAKSSLMIFGCKVLPV